MSIKAICLAQVYSKDHPQNAAFDYALDLAANHNAHLSICMAVPVIVIPMDYPAVMIGTVENVEDDSRLAKAKELAETMRIKAATNGVTASIDVYQSVLEPIFEWFASASRVHDLSIMHSQEDGLDFQSNLAETLLFQSGGPVIIVPEAWRQGSETKHIVVAWDDNEQCARATRFAANYLKSSTKVEILTVRDETDQKESDPWQNIGLHLAARFNNLSSNSIPRLDGSISKAIHNHAKLSRVDMIVMGAYGRSPAREWIFGGTTRELLQTIQIPLFMAH
jgi:nucleotide-binding universal stress UspA family protein